MADTYLPPGFKKCKSCQQVKPFEQFGKELKGKFGLKSKCRACISEKNKTYAAGPGAEVRRKIIGPTRQKTRLSSRRKCALSVRKKNLVIAIIPTSLL